MVKFEDRVFETKEAAEAFAKTAPKSSAEPGAVYVDPARLRALADRIEADSKKLGKLAPAAWSVAGSEGSRIRNVLRVLLGATSGSAAKEPTVIIKEVEKEYTLEELQAKIAEAKKALEAQKPARK